MVLWVECSLMDRETGIQSRVESYQRLLKMVLDTSLLNTQQYKVRIKGKVEQSRERSSTLPIHLGVVAIEKRAFGSPSTSVANFTYFLCLHIFFIYPFESLHRFYGIQRESVDKPPITNRFPSTFCHILSYYQRCVY